MLIFQQQLQFSARSRSSLNQNKVEVGKKLAPHHSAENLLTECLLADLGA